MIEKLKAWRDYIWDWAKRIFGRSKIIFANVVGVLLAGWVELYDPISMFDWDSITDKHEVAIAIGIGIQVLNVVLKSFYSTGPANFGRLNDEPVVEETVQISDEDEEEVPSPKAH